MTRRSVRFGRSSSGHRQPRPRALPGIVVSKAMAPPLNPVPSPTAASNAAASIGIWRLLAVAAPHVGALVVMLQTEADFSSRLGFVLAWGILNFFWIGLLRRPALSAALSLTLVVVLGLLPQPKHALLQLTPHFHHPILLHPTPTSIPFT